MKGESVVPPAAEQPEIVEAELGVKEYWYEVFRRVTVIPSGSCTILSIDVYKLLDAPPKDVEPIVLADGRVKAYYVPLDSSAIPPLGSGIKAGGANMLVLEADTPVGKRVEAVNVKVEYCGLNSTPSYDEVWTVYRAVVRLVEGRDPATQPLEAPEPVERVYRARLGR